MPRRSQVLVLAAALLTASGAVPQDYPSGCTSAMCHIIRKFIQSATNRFASLPLNAKREFIAYPFGSSDEEFHAWPRKDYRNSSRDGICFLREDGTAYCRKAFGYTGGTFDRRPRGTSFTEDNTHSLELLAQMIDAIRAAAPNWCFSTPGTISHPYSELPQIVHRIEFVGGPPVNGSCTQFQNLIVVTESRNEGSYVEVELLVEPTTPNALTASTLSGTVELEQAPPGAEVLLDGSSKGNANTEGKFILGALSPGKHSIDVRASGHKDFQQEVNITSAEPLALVVKMGAVPLSESEIEEGLQKGITIERMKTLVNEVGVDFALSNDSEKRLRSTGADDSLIIEIAKNKK